LDVLEPEVLGSFGSDGGLKGSLVGLFAGSEVGVLLEALALSESPMVDGGGGFANEGSKEGGMGWLAVLLPVPVPVGSVLSKGGRPSSG
jgi:hypothetical protein